ncbi:MAG: winged helix-turn-helix domain-containing protein [Chloroflexi bacterium]|nr:winged helix-turn-helix domain-containing protein [Chloroflexota bacterium]
MDRAEKPEANPEHQAPRDRISRMSAASLRINESLDFDTVLQEVVDSARTLTESRYGAITILGETGQRPDFIVSGLTREEHQGLWEMPQGFGFFEYLSGVKTPLRVSNIANHLRALGMPEFSPPVSASSLLVAPMRHQGFGVGTIYLAHEAEGREFSQEDEETLVMFASQAALVIANARRYREEQRAKADLETLINTSPVGVVVFAAGTGALLSINQEALRIVDGLRSPDQSPEQLLEVVTFRRSDGREVSLREYPLAQALSSGETIRAEEIVIQVPDGRRVKTIINSTPILSEEGGVASMVVTLQDLAPMKELGRQRAEFLSMVSQELLAPLTSIKGSAAAVLEDLTRLDIAKSRQFFSIIEQQADRMRGLIWDLLEVARIDAGTLLLTPESTDLAFLVGQAQASFLQGGAGNPVEVDLPPDLPQVAADRQRALQVLDRLLSNASGYSTEGSIITVSARLEDSHVAVCVADRGRDIPSQTSPLLFHRPTPAGGGSESVTGKEALSLAVCRGIVEAHGGRIWVENDGPGLGSKCIFTLPVAEEAAPRRAGSAGLSSAGNRRAARGQGRVLVVDDDPQVLWHIRNTLTEAGYTPVATWDPEEVERLIATERPHLVLLDSALVGADESGLMQRISKVTDAPLVLLSGRGADQERDLALAFESGADDYIAKPFSPTELVARVGAALRRREAPKRELHRESFQMGELSVDYVRHRVTVGGQTVTLTETEYRLLCELAVNAGRTLSREHLMSRVWSAREPGDSGVVRAYVKRLRQKLGENAANPKYIFNEPRVGYRLGESEEQDEATP